jgi:hypothetical protein
MHDVWTNIETFARLLARASDPFRGLDEVLADHGLDRHDWEAAQEDWAGRIAQDASLAPRFEQAIAAARCGAERPEETLFVEPDAAARAALLAPPLPFKEGTFRPPVGMAAIDAAPPRDLEETLLPSESNQSPLPFAKGDPR